MKSETILKEPGAYESHHWLRVQLFNGWMVTHQTTYTNGERIESSTLVPDRDGGWEIV